MYAVFSLIGAGEVKGLRPRAMPQSMGNKQKLRKRLFEQGVAALARTRPEIEGTYACPICRRAAPVLDPFTLEDVPPKSVGGRPLLLTCFDCNSTAGHQLDAHIHKGVKAAEIAAGTRPQAVRLSLGENTITANLHLGDGSLTFEGEPTRSDPEAHRAFFETLEKASAEGVSDLALGMTWKPRHDPWRERVAWLRVGYLYSFATLGYLYILRPELETVREQINHPEKRLLPPLVKQFKAPPGVDGMLFVFEPLEFRSVIVLCGDRAIILPDFENPSTFEERILATPNEEWPKQLSGKQLPLPRRPQFLLDFDPGLGRLISPD